MDVHGWRSERGERVWILEGDGRESGRTRAIRVRRQTCQSVRYLNFTVLHYKAPPTMSDRTATISRKTNETEIEVYINLDCQPGSSSQQIIKISTGIGFLDHVRLLHSTHTHTQYREINLYEPMIFTCMHATPRIDVPRPCQAQWNLSHAQGQR